MDNAVLNVKLAQARARVMEAATMLAQKKHPEALDALNAAMREKNPQVKALRQMEATAGLLSALAGLPDPEPEAPATDNDEPGEGDEGDDTDTDEEPAAKGKVKRPRKTARKQTKK